MNNPPKVLFITFDLPKNGESHVSLSIASILANLNYELIDFHKHISINLYKTNQTNNILVELSRELVLNIYDVVFVSAYIWSEYLILPVVNLIKKINKSTKVVLGGYQVQYQKNSLSSLYNECDNFITGYAENSVNYVIQNLNKLSNHQIVDIPVDFDQLKSPYIENIIPLNGIRKIRWETSRGCSEKCSFCAHRDLQTNKVHKLANTRIIDEMELFSIHKEIEKINILDPIFSFTKRNVDILECLSYNTLANISIQFKVDQLSDSNKIFPQFIDLVSNNNITLEIGVQSMHEMEFKQINRLNNISLIKRNISLLTNKEVDLEVSLIFGLPYQTFDSFKLSVLQLKSLGVKKIVAYPLMLLPGTELFDQKDKFGLNEESLGKFNIPTVTSSYSFSKEEWLMMESYANTINSSYSEFKDKRI